MTASRAPSLGVEAVTRLYTVYEQLRRERQLIDFESVLELTAAVILTDPAAAREVRDAYRYFVVDEFQDVNPLQKLLLDAWLGDRAELCVVGDPRQTIFSFTGATPAYLRSFSIDYPQSTMVRLVRDYRSTPQVVNIANRLMRVDQGVLSARGMRVDQGVVPVRGSRGEQGAVPARGNWGNRGSLSPRAAVLGTWGAPPRAALKARTWCRSGRTGQSPQSRSIPTRLRRPPGWHPGFGC